MRDLFHNTRAVPAFSQAALATSANGPAIDLKDANRAAIIASVGAVTGSGAFSLKLQESDTTTPGDFADVAAELVDSDAPATVAADAAYRLGYRGYKRYIRLVATKTGGTSIILGAVAVLGDLASRPA